jgi:hypothetical protein
MAYNYLSSPGTDRHDTTHFQQPDMSMEGSFHAPADRDNLFSKQQRTPRNPLASRRNPAVKVEFTPLMKSAMANRTRQANGLTTPIGLKAGFKVGATPLPEASTMDVQSSSFSETSMARTPMPQAADSSAMSTPMALPRRAEGEMDNGNGNVLTLREQEAVSSRLVSTQSMR